MRAVRDGRTTSPTRVDEIVPPGTHLNHDVTQHGPPALTDKALRRR